MKMTKKTMVLSAMLATLGAGALGIGTTFAATGTGIGDHRPMNDLVTAIATKFNLNTAEVQAVFDTQHEARVAEREQDHAERLGKAVTDGKLTQTQADAITAKATEEREFFGELKDMSREERHDAIRENVEDIKDWAKSNDIPKEFVPPAGFREGGNPGMMRGHMLRAEK